MTPDRSSLFFKHFLTFCLILCFSSPKLGLGHFSFQDKRIVCRNQNLGARCAPCYYNVIISRSSRLLELGKYMYAYTPPHLYLFLYLYILKNHEFISIPYLPSQYNTIVFILEFHSLTVKNLAPFVLSIFSYLLNLLM